MCLGNKAFDAECITLILPYKTIYYKLCPIVAINEHTRHDHSEQGDKCRSASDTDH